MFLNLINSGFVQAQQFDFAKLREEVASLLNQPRSNPPLTQPTPSPSQEGNLRGNPPLTPPRSNPPLTPPRRGIQRVERVECWQHQLWITISGVGARFISYRCLPSWLSQVINAIYKACNPEELEKLGKIIRDEIHNHSYEPEAVEELREVYREKREYFAAIEPEMEHRREAQEWLDGWRKVLSRCTSEDSLRTMAVEINAQSQEFEDLPQVMHEMREMWQKRMEQLHQS